ncbi:MAG TPA: PAS domain S-box protein [Syntrophales bacterium]|nr:PAS domain S-box protein [Syntrophales bacterium]
MTDEKRTKRQLIEELVELRRRLGQAEADMNYDFLASLVDGSEDAIIGKDLNGVIRSWNKGAERIYGYREEEVKGRHISILSPPGQTDEIQEILETIKRDGRVGHYETSRIRKDGSPVAVSLAVSPIKDAHGTITGIVTIVRDLTEQKRKDEALRRAGAYNRNLIEASLDPLVTIDRDGRISDVNVATERATGYSRKELIGTDFSGYFTRPELASAGYRKVFEEGFVRDYALEIRHRDGRVTPVLYNASVYRDEEGKDIGVFAAARDITERKKAEKDLRAASLYARNLIEASLDPLVTISADGKVTDVNRATVEATGVPREQLIGSDFLDYFTEPERAKAGYEQVFREGFVRDYPLALRHASGRVTEVLYNAATYRNEDGEVQGVFAAARDVSELRRAQEALQKSHDELERRVEERTTELRDREERLTHALEAGNMGIWELDVGTGKIWRSLRHDQIFGYKTLLPEWTYGMFLDHVLSEDRRAAAERFERALSERAEYSFECRIVQPDGDVRWLWMQGRPRLNERGEVVRMVGLVRDVTERAASDWIKTGIARIDEAMHGDPDLETMGNRLIAEVAGTLGAQVGAFYLMDENRQYLSFASGYAYARPEGVPERFRLGEGLIGQAALGKREFLVHDIPDDYIKVTSGLGDGRPRSLVVLPLVHEDRVKGVIEIASLSMFTDFQRDYLQRAVRICAINVEAAQNRERLARALAESRELTEELRQQHEEQKATNEELEKQAQRLTLSEEELKAQQIRLQAANEELRESNESLERQKREVEAANRDLSIARKDLEEKAEQLATASQYKSEFLANMSHELRTPLNSILLLARFLAGNKEGNLTAEQVESAGIVYRSGNDLLALIDDILDLSKIEVGRMELTPERTPVQHVADALTAGFGRMAEDRGLRLAITVRPDCPQTILVDRKRFEQILRNLLSNALKFTEEGGVTVDFGRPGPGVDLSRSGLDPRTSLAVAIRDTGIGIQKDKQELIFEAFQQAEKGTARKYGGTGLGLSISRELAHLLGGEIHLESEAGKGSVFTLYIPEEMRQVPQKEKTDSLRMPRETTPKTTRIPALQQIPDDRDRLDREDRTILIVEDDAAFAGLLADQCHERGFKCLVTATGEEGLALARSHHPSGVILDLRLPGMDGWAVLAALKESPETRHIPVHIMSVEEETIQAFRKGAIGFLSKPVEKEGLDEAFRKIEATFSKGIKDLLVVEDDDTLRGTIVKLVGNGDVQTTEAATGEETIRCLRSKRFDCMILDIGLPDMTGFELIEALKGMGDVAVPPIVVYTGRELTRDEEILLREYSESIIIKGVRSEERLLDEVSLFLHRMVDGMPEAKRRVIADLHDSDAMFRGRTILIVDDDMRNVFALSRVLNERGMKLLKAENGRKALDVLKQEGASVDLVLMDIMMPVMDGYEAMRMIRAEERFAKLPIIALTAKAMMADRQRCIAAGASDYLPKPVDVGRLLSVMRIWLYR